ncbi:MAG: HIT family protein [bacterium]
MGEAAAAPDDCRFCLHNGLLVDSPLFRTERFYVLGSIDPAAPGAAMIIPLAHAETPFQIPAADWADFPAALAFAHAHCGQGQPDGYTIGWNVGAVAGQQVFHAHLHVIPRFKGSHADGRGIRAAVLRL